MVTQNVDMETKICKNCGKTKAISEFYKHGFHPNGERRYRPKCAQCEREYRAITHYSRVNNLLESLNRNYVCEICGYDLNYAALCFHHETEEKNFSISQGRYRSDEEMLAELKICRVLCQNCHMELHYPHLDRG